ncbi:MAG: hypothetical protein KDD50_03625 [Bdellovibrionales bacterium]|nr:hypothetical protein [Bdellovibrionales bacterium]
MSLLKLITPLFFVFHYSLLLFAQQIPHPFDSAHSIAMDGYIENGLIYTKSNEISFIEENIRAQLKYTVGQFNGFNGVADLNRVDLTIKSIEQASDRSFKVTYRAKLFIAWSRANQRLTYFELYLPRSTDWNALRIFYRQFGYSQCLDQNAHNVDAGIFWYYYRPDKRNCAVKNSNLSVTIPMTLSPSPENTSNKSPEYDQIWKDGQLILTAIFGKAESGSSSEFDAGTQGFKNTYRQLIQEYGEPVVSNLSPGQIVSGNTPEIRVEFQSLIGPIKVNLFLVDQLQSAPADFIEKYNELTKISDFISYSGHSGLGANIRALANMGEFVTGQYQIFLVNGCDTFAYVDNSLRDAHAKANPLASPYKYFDLITNAMPSYFYSNPRSVMTIVKALSGSRKTYREILAEFDPVQKAVVIGEEDND